jgi:anion-transporting  ArsA/GET3 family ATPase
LIEEVIDGDFDRVSLHCAPYGVRLRFLLFGPSMAAWLQTLSDALRNGIRDSVEIGGGSERGDDNN